jgi:hypothetical protein
MISKLLTITTLILASTFLEADLPLLPLEAVEAEHVDFDEKTVHLIGHVKVVHDFGILCCNEAILILPQGKQVDEQPAVQEIFLKGTVSVDFTDGSRLTADEGDIDCRTLEGTFYADPPEKVVYRGYAIDKNKRVPIRATGRALKASIAKTSEGYALSSLRGEGAVNIEYLRPEPIQPEPAVAKAQEPAQELQAAAKPQEPAEEAEEAEEENV